jgi:hypothetical protein
VRITRRFRRIVPFVVALLLAGACGGAEDPQSFGSSEGGAAPVGDRVQHDGLSIELPSGWEGRVLPLDHPSAVLQAANFEFVPVGTELRVGELDPIKAMTAEHVLVTILPCGLVSFEVAARPAPEQMAVDELTFLPSGHPRVPSGHAFAHGSFEFDDRCLRIEVDFGTRSPAAMQTTMVNDVLASLSVA